MRFFIPLATDDQMAEEVLHSIVKFARLTTGWAVSDRRIFKLKHGYANKNYVVEVGQSEPVTREPVIAILESNAYLVCTPNRGVVRDMPILIGKSEVREIEDFEEAANKQGGGEDGTRL